MAPKTKQQKHLDSIRNKRKQSVPCEERVESEKIKFSGRANSDGCAYFSLSTGCGFKEVVKASIAQNLKPPSESTYHRHMKKMGDKVIESVDKSCDKYAKKIENGTRVTFDCRWNHPKNGSIATVSVIDANQAKVVSYYTVVKNTKSLKGNFSGSSTNMESEGLDKALAILKPSTPGKKLYGGHDHDNKSGKIIAQCGIDMKEEFDPGHAVLAFERRAGTYLLDEKARELFAHENKIAISDATTIKIKKGRTPKGSISLKECRQKYSNLISKLTAWFRYLVYNVPDEEKRIFLWKNSYNHLLGDHSKCEHPCENTIDETDIKRPVGRPKKKTSYWVWKEALNDELLQEHLKTFLEDTTPRLKNISQGSTQANESLNASIARHCPKFRNYTVTAPARIAMAIGKKNEAHFESEFMKDNYPDVLCDEAMEFLTKIEDELDDLREERLEDPKYYPRANLMRQKRKEMNRFSNGDYKGHYFG